MSKIKTYLDGIASWIKIAMALVPFLLFAGDYILRFFSLPGKVETHDARINYLETQHKKDSVWLDTYYLDIKALKEKLELNGIR